MNDGFPLGLVIVLACVFVAVILVNKDEERRVENPPPATLVIRSEQDLRASVDALEEEPVECSGITLDGSREHMIERLRCNGIAVIDWCELSREDRLALMEMGAKEERLCP